MGTKRLDPGSWIGDQGMRVTARGDDLLIRARFSKTHGDLDGFLAELRSAILVWIRQHSHASTDDVSKTSEKTGSFGDLSNTRFPINSDEERELDAIAVRGPSAVYQWIYGPQSLMAKAMEGASWLQFGVQSPMEGCRRILRSIRDHHADLRTLRRRRR